MQDTFNTSASRNSNVVNSKFTLYE